MVPVEPGVNSSVEEYAPPWSGACYPQHRKPARVIPNEATIKAYLTEIRNRLDKAAGIGRAADACAGAGFHEKGLEVALDTEQLLYEVRTLLNAASLIKSDRPTKLSLCPRWADREATTAPAGMQFEPTVGR